jgi:hypothetical protein
LIGAHCDWAIPHDTRSISLALKVVQINIDAFNAIGEGRNVPLADVLLTASEDELSDVRLFEAGPTP